MDKSSTIEIIDYSLLECGNVAYVINTILSVIYGFFSKNISVTLCCVDSPGGAI